MDRFQYGYDRSGNRLYKQNMLSSANSELYMADDVPANEAYDKLGRLKNFQRGTLSVGSPNNNNGTMPDTVATASVDKNWTLDALGNWDAVTGETQNRQHNKRNQATSVKGATLTYDANGNLTKDERGFSFTYDAWNRLMQVKNAGNSVVASYYYDGLGRRMVEMSGGLARRFYHSLDWQVVEEQQADSCTCGVLRTRTQYVWGLGFVDELVLRDNDADGTASTGRLGNNGNQSTGPTTGLEERLYSQQDANYNVTSLTSTSAAVQERYLYDPYGSVTYKTGTWGSRTASAYDWAYLHQGGRWDADAGLYHFRRRDYSPTLGRWVQPDPLEYVDGMSLYEAYRSGPVTFVDPNGTKIIVQDPVPVYDENGKPVWRTHYYDGTVYKGHYPDVQRFENTPTTEKYYGGLNEECKSKADFAAAGKKAAADAGGVTGLGPTGEGLVLSAAGEVASGVVGVIREGRGVTAGGRPTNEYGKPLGPSGKDQVDVVKCATRKGAKDAARQAGKGAPVNHPSPVEGGPHYHPTGSDGEKRPGSPHFEYPKK